MRYTAVCLLLMFCTTILQGAENAAGNTGMRERSRGGRGGRMFEQLRSKYPKESAEIEKLRSSDPEAARQKMRELMRKAGPEMGFRRRWRNEENKPLEPSAEQLAALKAKYPEEFAEYEKLKSSDPEKAAAKLRELMQKEFGSAGMMPEKNLRDRNRRAVGHVMIELKKRYPERMAEIEKMQKLDPDGARKELRKLFAESNMSMPRGARELNYEYVDPKLQQQNMRPGFPGFGGFGRMGGQFRNRGR